MSSTAHQHLSVSAPSGGPRPHRRPLAVLLALALLLAALWALGYRVRQTRAQRLAGSAAREQNALPVAAVAPVQLAPPVLELSLPGNIQALLETPIYARADGYVRRRLVDIGDRVQAGQLLAEIESPELDQQILEAEANLRRARSSLEQAQAALEQVRAHMELAQVTAQRWQTLVAKGVLSKQEGDEKQAVFLARKADVAAAEAAVRAAEEAVAANESSLRRLLELRAFRQVRAPFAGVITARNVEVGALVTAGSSAAVREMYRLARIDRLRVQVMVPQSEAPLIRVGLPCALHVAEFGERRIPAVVRRTATALDPSTRTLLTEVEVANPAGKLLPGMYAIVHFRLERLRPPLLIPSGAYRNTEKGPVAAVVGPDGAVRFASLRLGRDYGGQIEVLSGLEVGQRVVVNLTDEIRPGVKVRVVSSPKGRQGRQERGS